jgi:hypothetical protein
VSADVLRRFHRHLLKFWRTTEFQKHVYLPRTAAEVQEVEAKYAKMGFPGACVSYDGVPVPYPNCPAGATGQHKGKEGYPTRRFMVGVDSDGLILSMGNGWDHLLFPCKYASFSLHPYFSVSFSYLPYLTVSYRILPVRCILTRISPYLSVFLCISPVSRNTAGNFSTRLYFLRIFPYLSVF